jgi:hypothetical protein
LSKESILVKVRNGQGDEQASGHGTEGLGGAARYFRGGRDRLAIRGRRNPHRARSGEAQARTDMVGSPLRPGDRAPATATKGGSRPSRHGPRLDA